MRLIAALAARLDARINDKTKPLGSLGAPVFAGQTPATATPVEPYTYSTPLDIHKVIAVTDIPNDCGPVPAQMTYEDSSGKLNTLSMVFIMGSTWVVAYANPNILDLIEAMGAPIIASLLCLLPMYAIRKAPSLAKYRGRLDNLFVTAIGLLTILNIVYKLF